MTNFLKKGAVTGLLMSLIAAALPASAQTVTYTEDPNADGASLLLLVLTSVGVTTTLSRNRSSYDSSKAVSLIDQAYEGSGDKLEVLAQGSHKNVEDVADAIVTLDKAGKLDIAKPEKMAQLIATAIK